MVYSIKEYDTVFDTPSKKEEELAIVEKIMELLNNNKYDNLDKMIDNNKTYEDFLKNQNLTNVIKHFGNTINEDDFKLIIQRFRELINKKQQIDEKDVKTTKINDSEYNTYKGVDKTYYLDNSNSDKTIQEQMKDLQPTEEKFQTADSKTNTENIMKTLENEKKDSLDLSNLTDIDFSDLNNEEKNMVEVAKNIENETGKDIKIDLNEKVIVDEDKISKIEKNDDNEYNVVSGESEEKEVEIEKPTQQKTLELIPKN